MAVKVNHRTPVHRGRVFLLVKENVTLDNGRTTDLEFVEHPGAAAIVPLTAAGEVVLIRQYRHAIGGYIWEIPAGTLNAGEPPLDCARRELIEEAGFSAADWQALGEITPVPGYSNERIHIFLASDLRPAQQDLDPDEVIAVHRFSLTEAVAMIGRGEIQDAKSICGLLLTQKWLERHLGWEDQNW
jgi:ADP-ribose pyrophosphatase